MLINAWLLALLLAMIINSNALLLALLIAMIINANALLLALKFLAVGCWKYILELPLFTVCEIQGPFHELPIDF